MNKPALKSSDYRVRGFTQLHIKKTTKDRMNLAKARLAASRGKVVTHDDLINHLFDHCADVVVIEAPAQEYA